MQEKVGIQISLAGDGSGIKAVVTGARRDFDALARSGADAGGKIASSFDTTRAGLVSVSEQLAQSRRELIGFFSISQGVQIGRELLNYADSIGDVSSSLGLSAEALQSYRYVANLAGVDNAALESAFGKLQIKIGEAADGNEQAKKTFADLGISITGIDGGVISTSNALAQISDRMAAASDQTEKAQIVNDLFGRGQLKMINVLDGGSDAFARHAAEARAAGAVMSNELVKASGDAADKLDAIGMTIKTNAAVAMSDLAPLVESVGGGLAELSLHAADVGRVVAVVAAMMGGRYAASMVAAAAAQVSQVTAARAAIVSSMQVVKVKEAEAVAMLASTQATYANTTGFARLAAAERVYAAQRAATAATEAAAAVAAANTARTVGMLSRALAVLGGPAGIAFGAAAALGLWAMSAKGAATDTDRLSVSTDGLADSMNRVTATDAAGRIIKLRDALAKVGDNQAGAAKLREMIAANEQIVKAGAEQQARLQAELDKATTKKGAAGTQEKEKAAYAQHLAQRLEQFRQSQMSEAQVEAKRYIDGKNTLDESLKAKNIKQEEYSARMIQLEADTQARLLEIAGKSSEASGQMVDGNSHVAAYDEYKKGLLDRVEALRQTTLTEAQIEAEKYISQQATLDAAEQRGVDVRAMREQLEIEHQQRMQEIVDNGLNERSSLEQYHADVVNQMRAGAVQNGMQLMQVFASRSKTAAMAVLVLEKALGISSVLINSKVAAMKALAQLGPIAGAPVAASITAAGYVSAGLIAATGLAQAYQMNTGSAIGASPVYNANPVTGTPSGLSAGGAQSIGGGDRSGMLQVNIYGGYSEQTLRDDIIPAIANLVNANDINIVNINSRNGQDLIAAARNQ